MITDTIHLQTMPFIKEYSCILQTKYSFLNRFNTVTELSEFSTTFQNDSHNLVKRIHLDIIYSNNLKKLDLFKLRNFFSRALKNYQLIHSEVIKQHTHIVPQPQPINNPMSLNNILYSDTNLPFSYGFGPEPVRELISTPFLDNSMDLLKFLTDFTGIIENILTFYT